MPSQSWSRFGLIRDHRGWKIKTKLLTVHPVSYGTATLARISIGLSETGPRLMLHYFPPQGPSPKYHDHPWPFVTLVLWGGYADVSVTPDGRDVIEHLPPGTIRFRSANHRHKTANKRRCVTLVLAGADERQWCEGDAEEWVCGGDVTDFNETAGSVRA